MILNVKPIRRLEYGCFEADIVTYAEFMGYDFETMFIPCWSFKYTLQDGTIENLSTLCRVCSDQEKWDILKNVHGIEIEKNEVRSIDELENIIVNITNSQKVPILLEFDWYHVPWDFGYQKYHNDHYCLALGKESDRVVIIDPYVNEKRIEVYREQIMYVRKYIFIRKEMKKFSLNENLELAHNYLVPCNINPTIYTGNI